MKSEVSPVSAGATGIQSQPIALLKFSGSRLSAASSSLSSVQ
jgi:hypothetical protein